MAGFPEFIKYDGLGLAELVRKGEVTPLELVEASISRIEQYNPKLNAVVRTLFDDARQAAQDDIPDGAFKGVPMLIKDLLIAYKGVPTGSGSRFLQQTPMPYDSEMLLRFKAAGAIIMGKTNTPEFGLQSYTEPEAHGATHNPWNLEHSPGGSSGGSGAATAAGLVPFASGGDGGGSIRIPATVNGIFGMKPTRGRTPTGPLFVEHWAGFAIEHILSRSVRDSAAMLDCVTGEDVGAPYYAPPQQRPFLDEVQTEPGKLRIAYTTQPLMGQHVDPDCEKALADTVTLLRELGHELIEATPPIDRETVNRDFVTVLCGQTYGSIKTAEEFVGRKARLDEFETETWSLAMMGKQLAAGDYALAVSRLQALMRPMGQFFEDYDVLLTPTLADPPHKIGAGQVSPEQLAALKWLVRLRVGWLMKLLKVNEQVANEAFEYVAYTVPFNITGQPAMSVPLQWNSAGLPIGMQFVGRFGDEATLFRLAGQLERAQPWFDKMPPGFE